MKYFEVRINGTDETDDLFAAITNEGFVISPEHVKVREMPIVADRVLANGARGVFVEAGRYMKVVQTLMRMSHDSNLTIADTARQMLEDLGEVR